MTTDGYPDEQELKYIEDFDILTQNPMDLVKYIKELWNYRDDCVTIEKLPHEYRKEEFYYKVSLVTWGWSGNEDLIKALQRNKYFFTMYHSEWHRGGLWVFELPDYKQEDEKETGETRD